MNNEETKQGQKKIKEENLSELIDNFEKEILEDSDNYIELCEVTESHDFEKILGCIDNRSLTGLGNIMLDFVDLSMRLDELKKRIFYGDEYILSDKGIRLKDKYFIETKDRLRDEQFIRILHSIIGITTEAGELNKMFYDYLFNGKEFDAYNFAEEIGDVSWYQSLGISACRAYTKAKGMVGDISWSRIWAKNIAKLYIRFKDKFSTHAALNRDLDKEREVLEEEG